MAQGYALRYYKSYDLNGHKVKLDIYKKYPAIEYAPAPMEIGRVLQGLSLDVQGEQDDIISPIVKTSLSMTFADAPGEEKGKKTGDWEEFYTPDSTGYKVLLYIDGALYWSGYVTPDSFEEDLDYHGSVTIVARDNIGHLQDFQFDAEGNHEAMISVRSLIDSAWSKVECLLSLSYASGSDVVWPTCEGYTALDCLINVEAFAQNNWYEALEAVLDSFGLVLRYVGNNKVMVMPLRALPCLDKAYTSAVEVKNVLLQAPGYRMLTPACKSIVDQVDYEVGDIYAMNIKDSDYEAATLTIYNNEVDTWQPSASSYWRRYGNIGMLNPFYFSKNPRGGASFANGNNIFLSVVDYPNTNNYIGLQRSFIAGELIAKIAFSFDGRFYSGDYYDEYINIGSARQQKVTLWYALECNTCIDGACGHYWYDMESNAFQPDSFFSYGIDSGYIQCDSENTFRNYSFKKGIRYRIEIDTNSRVDIKGLSLIDNMMSTIMYVAEGAKTGVFEYIATSDAPYLGIVLHEVEVAEGEEPITAHATLRIQQIVEQIASAELSYGQSSSEGRYGSHLATVEHELRIPEGTTSLTIRLFGFTADVSESGAVMRPSYTPIQNLINSGKAYCRISDLTIQQTDAGSYHYSKVTSVYDEAFNLLLTRTPKLGSGPLCLSPKVILNGIYLPSLTPASDWRWNNADVTSLQAIIAQQILMYYSQPNSIITGTLLALAVNNEILNFNCLWHWHGKKLALISGQLDLLTGFIESAKLREFIDWDNMWPSEGLLMTESSYYVVTENGVSNIIVGK